MYMTFTKRQNVSDEKKLSGCHRLGVGRWYDHVIFWGDVAVPYNDCGTGNINLCLC